MRNDVCQLILSVIALVIGAGCEELFPKFLGVGFPFLLMSVAFVSVGCGQAVSVLFAIAAGLTEDALSSLTPMTSVSYFIFVSVVTRRLKAPHLTATLAYPCYQLWLAIWMGGLNVFTRILMSFPIGILTSLLVGNVILLVIRKAAIDERD